MGKRPDELNVDNTAFGTANTTPDARASEWNQFLIEIEDLLATGAYTWAQETLESIYEFVKRTEHVTEGQKKAVENIAAGARKSRGRSRPNYFGKYQRRR